MYDLTPPRPPKKPIYPDDGYSPHSAHQKNFLKAGGAILFIPMVTVIYGPFIGGAFWFFALLSSHGNAGGEPFFAGFVVAAVVAVVIIMYDYQLDEPARIEEAKARAKHEELMEVYNRECEVYSRECEIYRKNMVEWPAVLKFRQEENAKEEKRNREAREAYNLQQQKMQAELERQRARLALEEGRRKIWEAAYGWAVSELNRQYGEPAEFGKNRTLRFSGHP